MTLKRDHPFKMSATFYEFCPLPPPVGSFYYYPSANLTNFWPLPLNIPGWSQIWGPIFSMPEKIGRGGRGGCPQPTPTITALKSIILVARTCWPNSAQLHHWFLDCRDLISACCKVGCHKHSPNWHQFYVHWPNCVMVTIYNHPN